MENLSLKQKIVFFSLIGAMIVTIGYYLIQNTGGRDIVDIYDSEEIIMKKEVAEEEEIVVHITGCVENEGIVKLKKGARIADAIELAGGLTLDANIKNVNLAYMLEDGQKIYIPSNIEDDTENVRFDVGEDVIKSVPNNTNSNQVNGKVNINTATQTELETLPGIGPATALKIIDHRAKNGRFTDTEEIKEVSGIGESKYEAIKDLIRI